MDTNPDKNRIVIACRGLDNPNICIQKKGILALLVEYRKTMENKHEQEITSG